MRLETNTTVASHPEPKLESPADVDVVSLMTTTVALFGLALVSVLSLLNIVVG